MKQEKFEYYLKAANKLSAQRKQLSEASGELLQLIEDSRKESENLAWMEFFSGESAFYSGQYEKALQHYLKATSIPQFHFFCYRASAWLFHGMHNLEKALSFVQKALQIYPKDYLTLSLYETLLLQDNQREDALEVQHRLKALEEEALNKVEMTILAHQLELNKLSPPVTNCMEQTMNTESDIFSSPKSQDSKGTQALTHRLYPSPSELGHKDPYANKAFEELKNLASHAPACEMTERFISKETGLDHAACQALEKRIQMSQASQAEISRHYLEQSKKLSKNPDFCLYYLNGWPSTLQSPSPLYLTENSRKSSGGIFLRWNGKGIAINPGPHFLENFHQHGLHIREIDFIIVTGERPDCYADVKEIYDLNHQLNKMSGELQVIHYYLNQKAFQELSKTIKTHFKQERNSLHSLELYVDSPEVESVELFEGATLHYFLASAQASYPSLESRDENSSKRQSSLGIRLDLKSPSKGSVRMGYIGQAGWHPLIAHHLGACDLLITGFGNTNPNDYNKLSYNSDCLGYYGSYTLLEEISPKLMLCGEFGGRDGDIRLEAVQKLNLEYSTFLGGSSRTPQILPADIGMLINLRELQVKCSLNDEWIVPSKIRVIKTADAFGRLQFLAPSCCY
jgi:tetratricopeptide (TPR) repeat protein